MTHGERTLSGIAEELERLDKLATPGPWEKSEPDYFGDFSIRQKGKALAIAVIVNGAINELSGHGDEHRANADLVILIRNNLPAFIEAAALLSGAEAREGVLREAFGELVAAVDALGLRELVAGWNGENRADGPYEPHPTKLVVHLRTKAGQVYALDAATESARKALGGTDGQH